MKETNQTSVNSSSLGSSATEMAHNLAPRSFGDVGSLSAKVFLDTSPLPLAASPIQISRADYRSVGGITPPLGLLARSLGGICVVIFPVTHFRAAAG
jgi:hypothetical protein